MLSSKRLSQIQVGHISSVIIDDYILICGLRVNLTANIVGNIKGHKFLWEQISGSSLGITYLSPMDGTILDFAVEIPPAVRDDKLFRFWIDKGTRREQHYDVWVWSSFVDYYKSNITGDVGIDEFDYVDQIGVPPTLYAYCGYTPHYYSNLNTVNNESTVFLYWNDPAPNKPTTLLNYFIEYYDLQSYKWKIFNPSAINFLDKTIQPNIQYRVGANYYNTKTSQLTQRFSNIVSYNNQDIRWNTPELFYNEYYDGNNTIHATHSDQNTLTSFMVFNNTNLTNIDIYDTLSTGDVTINQGNLITSYTNYTAINLSIIPTLDNTDYYATPDIYGINNNNITTSYTNFSNINIGG